MGTQQDWQRLDRHIDQAVQGPPAIIRPYLDGIDVEAVVIPPSIAALSFSEVAKQFGALKSKCLKQDGTRKINAKRIDLETLKFLYCRWHREKAEHLSR